MEEGANFTFCSVETAVTEISAGHMIVLVDTDEPTVSGVLMAAAEKATAQIVNFMAREACGLICAPLSVELTRQAGLDLMVARNECHDVTAFTVSVDAAEGLNTGMSAEERAHTVRKLASAGSKPEDFVIPGHVFPLIASNGGVLKRFGYPEAAVDLASLAGLNRAGIVCQIINDDGSVAQLKDLKNFCTKNNLKMLSIAQLVSWRLDRTRLIERVATVQLPTEYGDFKAIAYRSDVEKDPDRVHIAIIKGDITGGDPPLVRVHSECMTGDVFGSLRCDCGPQLHAALKMIEKAGRGVVLYMRQEGRGIGLVEKLKAYELQEHGLDTVDANVALGHKPDLRDYGIGAQILKDLGLCKIRLITNNPTKIVGLQAHGLQVVERIPMEIQPNRYNERYLHTKEERMGHLLHF